MGDRRNKYGTNPNMEGCPVETTLDVIGGKWLTEINVTSPTGIVAIDRCNGTDTAAKILDAIERRLAGRS